jgi:hypothetical protein
MQSVRPRSISALLALTVGASVLTGGAASPASADGAAPTGAYALNTTSIWSAQTVQLTETSLADDVDADGSITRVVTWGDGKTETVPAGTTKLRHAYAKTGTFPVSVQLTDTEGNVASGTIAGAAAVKVAATPGTFKLDRTTGYVWTDPSASTPADQEGWSKVTVSLAGIPATATRVRLIWGDGGYSLVSRTQKTASWYYQRGTYKISAAMENSDGQSAAKAVGTVKVVEDTYKPTVTIKTPKSPSKASSWKTISGTSSDKGLGIIEVDVWIWQVRGTNLYYYNFSKKKWVKKNDGILPAAGYKVVEKPAKGAWKVPVSGIKKGELEVGAVSADGNWNWSSVKRKYQTVK